MGVGVTGAALVALPWRHLAAPKKTIFAALLIACLLPLPCAREAFSSRRVSVPFLVWASAVVEGSRPLAMDVFKFLETGVEGVTRRWQERSGSEWRSPPRRHARSVSALCVVGVMLMMVTMTAAQGAPQCEAFNDGLEEGYWYVARRKPVGG